MLKLTRAALALNGRSRSLVTEKRVSAVKVIRRGLACAEHGDEAAGPRFTMLLYPGEEWSDLQWPVP